jgi:Ribonuclease G/E
MCNQINCSHDFDDAIDDIFGGLETAPSHVLADAEVARATRAATTYTENCPSCRGTGQFRSYSGRVVGNCFKCKGKGTQTFKTSSEQRAKSQASAAALRDRKAATAAEQAHAWLAANPVEAEWLKEPVKGDFTFHADMLAALIKYGELTERQEVAVRNAAAKSAARKLQWAAERAARDAEIRNAKTMADQIRTRIASTLASR